MNVELFSDFMRAKYGGHRVLARKLTPKMRKVGYLVAVTPEQHALAFLSLFVGVPLAGARLLKTAVYGGEP